MATFTIPFGAFTESPKKAFVQSPHKAREESGVSWTYTRTRVGLLVACHTRPYPSWGYYSGAASRTVFDEVFLRQRRVWDNGAVEGGEYDHFGDFTNITSGTPPDISAYTSSSETLTTDNSSTIVVDISFTGSGLPTITAQDIWDMPYTYAQFKDDIEDLYTSKFTAWEAAAPTDEFWKYDTDGSAIDDSGHTHHGGLGFAGVNWEDLFVSPGFSLALRMQIFASKVKQESSPSIGVRYRVTESHYIAGSLDSTVIREPIDDGEVYVVEPDIAGAAPNGSSSSHSDVGLIISLAASQPP